MMTSMLCPRRCVAVLLLPLVFWGCSNGTGSEVLGTKNVDDVVFLTQNQTPDVWMDALFRGVVTKDADGCLRLDTPDRATVVWPVDFTLEVQGDQLLVLNGDGIFVGRIGGTFSLGGGEVPALHEGIPMAAPAKQLAAQSCPGRFWIVGEVQ